MGKLEEIREYLRLLVSRQPTETEGVVYRYLDYLMHRLETETKRREAAEAAIDAMSRAYTGAPSPSLERAVDDAIVAWERAKEEEHDSASQKHD